MKYFLSLLFFTGVLLSYGQDKALNSITQSDWKLVNADTYPANNGNELHDYSLSKDSTLRLVYCYIHYFYKVLSYNSNSLVLLQYQSFEEKTFGEKLIFVSAQCNEEHNQFNNPKYLSFKPLKYHIIISDSPDMKPRILNRAFIEVALTEKSSLELYHFIFGNRFTCTHQNFLIIESTRGMFGVVSDSEEVCIPPNFNSIRFDRAKSSLPNNVKRSTFFTCTNAQEAEFEMECH